ncbi:MAG: translation initiation factor IF-2 [Candidatus Diapherotrites archaeon CG08_land_8_20_14_0_20_34_12]|nr:MAG: translation initiation factor IF-2 [Candidatus Diapherotrites archaeon CG08_land_8_20_14_0_20_34_12]
MIRQPIITVLGHIDHGKCISGDSQIFLANGRIKTIKALFEEFKDKAEILLDDDGIALQLRENLYAFGEENGKIKPVLISHIWKLKKERLMAIKTRTGGSIKTTPEHPFLTIDKNFSIIYKQAKDVEIREYVAVPAETKVTINAKGFDEIKAMFIEKLAENPEILIFVDNELNIEIKTAMANINISANGLISNQYHAFKNNRFRLNEFIPLARQLGIKPETIYEHTKCIKHSSKKQRASHRSTKIELPKTEKEFKEMLYVIGMIWGDGSLQNAQLNSNDAELLKKYKEFFENSLKVKCGVCRKRTCYEAQQYGWKTFKVMLESVFDFPTKNKCESITCPQILQEMPNEYIAPFIQGYFDTDGYVDRNAAVEVSSASESMITGLNYLLFRFGINSKIYTKTGLGKKYYVLHISGRNAINSFVNQINFSLKRKRDRLNTDKTTTNRVFELTPISGTEIANLRKGLSILATELRIPYLKKIESYEMISIPCLKKFTKSVQAIIGKEEFQKKLAEKIRVLELLKEERVYGELYKTANITHRRLVNYILGFKNDGFLIESNKKYKTSPYGIETLNKWHGFGKNKVQKQLLNLINIVESELRFVQVINTEEIANTEEFVYDLTQPKTHNFIANGFVIHNTKLLDRIRGTTLADREAGRITQHIGATEVPLRIIDKISGELIKKFGFSVNIPGLLFIDTPGHAAFTNLRKRGGSIADLAIVVVDATQGFQPQTIEAVNILKTYKTPFIVALNKIDKVSEWNSVTGSFLANEKNQTKSAQNILDEKVYQIVSLLYGFGFESERFDRITDFKKQIAIVPISAIVGEGIPEILMMLTGLSQRFLKDELEIAENAEGKGTVLEVKEERGLGITVDVILYQGSLKVSDTIVVGGKNGIIETKIRALLKPKPLSEIRDPKSKFDSVSEIFAASGIKISAPFLEEAISGSPLIKGNSPEHKQLILDEIKAIKIDTEQEGVIAKVDALGSLEAFVHLMKENGISVRKADVGNVTKKDVVEAVSVKENDIYNAVIFCFNSNIEKAAEEEAKTLGIKIFKGDVIYTLLEEYKEWVDDQKKHEKEIKRAQLVYPAKIKVLPGHIFRNSGPAIFGIEVLAGKLKPKVMLVNKGKTIGLLESIQNEGKNIDKAERGNRVAISVSKANAEKHFKENDILYVYIPEKQFADIEKYLEMDEETKEAFEEIKNAASKEKENEDE